jgi:hypothetical protein
MSLNTLSGPDSRDLSVRDPAGRIRVSAWFCQTLSEVPACYLGITRGRVRTFYLPVLPLYGFTKLYTNPFLIIYLLPNFKLPVLVLTWGLEQKKTKSVFPHVQYRLYGKFHFKIYIRHVFIGKTIFHYCNSFLCEPYAAQKKSFLIYGSSGRQRIFIFF